VFFRFLLNTFLIDSELYGFDIVELGLDQNGIPTSFTTSDGTVINLLNEVVITKDHPDPETTDNGNPDDPCPSGDCNGSDNGSPDDPCNPSSNSYDSCLCDPPSCPGSSDPPSDVPPESCGVIVCSGLAIDRPYIVLNKNTCKCEKIDRPWYYDSDKDEYHDPNEEIKIQKESPGIAYEKTTKGEDCDDNNLLVTTNCYKEYFIDNDDDGYHSGTIRAKTQGTYKTTTLGPDCDDNLTTGANVHKLNKCGKCEVEPVSGVCGDCFKSPVPKDTRISSLFMSSRDCNVCSKTHGGTDYAVPTGTPIKSSASGVVARSYFSNTYGNVVIIDHGISNTNNDHVYTLYAHGSSRIVKQGDVVNEGDNVIYSGNTGNSTGPHLHYEIIKTSELPFNGSFFKGLDKRYGPDELKNPDRSDVQ
jgi:hypothetical protein